MPVWEDYLTEDEIWAVIIFLYEQAGWQPRTWEEAGASGEEHEIADCALPGGRPRIAGETPPRVPSSRGGCSPCSYSQSAGALWAACNPQSARSLAEKRSTTSGARSATERRARATAPRQTYMLPRPRDFTKGVYQIRTTASGELPTDADIRRVIDDGMPGTAMPEWKTSA